MIRKTLATLALALTLALTAGVALAQFSAGQTIYVPCSSATFHGPKTRNLDLTVTLIVRNLDPKRTITVNSVDYHRTDGKLVRRFLDKPMQLGPLAAKEFLVDQKDESGGTAASFLVRWKAEGAVNPALAEAVMISSSSGLGVSYVSRGVPIQE